MAQVEYAEWTENGLLRQPRFEGLRMDKKPTDVRRERAKPAAAVKTATSKKPGTRATTTAAGGATAGPGASLDEYARKRDFTKTPEPKPEAGKPNKAPVFVVQEHHATRLHYDLRLEVDGVLKSWAVTKQPGSDPSVKRLAVQTEDHPLAYAQFAGDIPEGEYGAGYMEIWDRGTYAADKSARPPAEAIAAGKMEFELRGKRLKGRYALVRMAGRGRGENWLLIKMKDAHARRDATTDDAPAASPRSPRPGSSPSRRKPAAASASRATPTAKGKHAPVDFTHVDKTWFPGAPGGAVTKGDVIEYYLGVADKLIPHLRDRPITLERMPDGIGEGKPRFWQKNTPDHYPSWIPRVELPSEAGKPVRYALVNDVDTLAYLVNQGAVTFHPFLSRVQDLDRPDYVLFDLDPGGARFADVVKVARAIHDTLRGRGEIPLVKTSGKSGLHVLVAWRETGDYDAARAWAMQTAESVIGELPDLATVERLKAERDGRVYIDVIQNARGHHAVPPYVLRPTPQATVSTPLDWKEVTPKLDPKQFTIRSAPKRFAGKPDRLLSLVVGG